jgi:hypothetical protein
MPSRVLNATRVPSGETRGAYTDAGSSPKTCFRPSTSMSVSSKPEGACACVHEATSHASAIAAPRSAARPIAALLPIGSFAHVVAPTRVVRDPLNRMPVFFVAIDSPEIRTIKHAHCHDGRVGHRLESALRGRR